MMPLNYAILKLFTDGRTACPEEVIEALKADYVVTLTIPATRP